MQNPKPHRPRKPYAPPRLTIYGDLRDVTLTNLTKNMNDPGNSSNTMT
ncbi:lasso RiPP family leader peptide-containing protein [Longimicrobium sp.]|nr:lasso RiPP family leader peptide-containing protein [Longimicrobium sp.]HEX6039028.1 lasso RiPP family leader peptide-containing protein [Longimicrobium sp.]